MARDSIQCHTFIPTAVEPQDANDGYLKNWCDVSHQSVGVWLLVTSQRRITRIYFFFVGN